MAEPTIKIPHMGIMGIGHGFIGLDGNLLVVCMTGRALILFGWLGRPCYSMTVSACHSIELMAATQKNFPPQACNALMTCLTSATSHAFRIHVSGR